MYLKDFIQNKIIFLINFINTKYLIKTNNSNRLFIYNKRKTNFKKDKKPKRINKEINYLINLYAYFFLLLLLKNQFLNFFQEFSLTFNYENEDSIFRERSI